MHKLMATALLLTLGACASTPPDERTGRVRTPDIARSGGVTRSVGADVPMAIACRGLNVARALTRSTGLAQLSSACSAASRL